MDLQDMITEEHRLCGATRLLNLLTSNSVFSEEVKQAIRIEGMRLLNEPRRFDLSAPAEIIPLPNAAWDKFKTFNAGQEARALEGI
jgi:hypothetical protein